MCVYGLTKTIFQVKTILKCEGLITTKSTPMLWLHVHNQHTNVSLKSIKKYMKKIANSEKLIYFKRNLFIYFLSCYIIN